MSTQPKLRDLPLGDALLPTIDRLKAIANEAGDTLLLANGPPHPDYELLDMCGDALHFLNHMNATRKARVDPVISGPWSDADRARDRALFEEAEALKRQAIGIMRRARKIQASTASGIYAKALLVRSSQAGAAELATSLAADLIAMPGLRASLWASEGG
jgi:hypothetical protein